MGFGLWNLCSNGSLEAAVDLPYIIVFAIELNHQVPDELVCSFASRIPEY